MYNKQTCVMIKSKKTESIGGIIECILHAWMLKEY